MLDKLVSFFLISAVLGVAVSYSKLYLFHIALVVIYMYILVNYFNKQLILDKINSTSKLQYMFVYHL